MREVTRYIEQAVQNELWGRAAGRCEFPQCNLPLYRSPVTLERVNVAQKAHIYSFSEDGPRGRGPYGRNGVINEIENLMLLCHSCHKTIDKDIAGGRYSPELLKRWKQEHERRVAIVTGIAPNRKSHVVLYCANIGTDRPQIQVEDAQSALFPRWFPAEERPLWLSMSWEGRDDDPAYWITEDRNLRAVFETKIRPLINEAGPKHFSVFAFAPIPLLVRLGSLFTEKPACEVYQLQRDSERPWSWASGPADCEFQVRRPKSFKNPPVLIMSLSDKIASDRVTSVTGKKVSIWEMTIPAPHNRFLKSKHQLARYKHTLSTLIVDIGVAHGKSAPISIFPAIPIACAVELGRVRMPKADSPWVIYDQNPKHGRFVETLTIGGNNA